MPAYASQGIVICILDPTSGSRVIEDTNLNKIDCLPDLNIQVAAGEFEAGRVLIYSEDEIEDLEIEIDTISNNKIDLKEYVDVRYIKEWYQGANAWKSIRQQDGDKQLVPELLVKDDALIIVNHKKKENLIKTSKGYVSDTRINDKLKDEVYIQDLKELSLGRIGKNKNKQIWLTVHFPENVESGVYKGRLNIRSKKNQLSEKKEFQVTVLPFKLQDSVLEYSIYYRSSLSDGGSVVKSDIRSKSQMRAELNNIYSHGVTNPTIYEPLKTKKSLDTVLELREDEKIQNEKIYYLGVATDNYENRKSVLSKKKKILDLKKAVEKFGVKDIYVYGIDEAERKKVKGQYLIWDEYRAVGIKIFVATWQPSYFGVLAGKVDLVVSGISQSIVVNELYLKNNTKPFLYNRPQIGIENPAVYRNNYGIRAWQYGYLGVMNYAYQHAMGSIWDDTDHEFFRDHVFAYPVNDGVIDTIAWEGFREAIDDVRYVSTLIKLSEKTNNNEAKELLSEIRADFKSSPNTLRKILIKEILALCQKYPIQAEGICLK